MGSCCGITGGGPPKPQSSSYPNRAAKPATANVPSTPAAPAATSRIAEVPSGVTTPASSPKLSVRSPAGVGQLRVSIVPFGSMIAVLTSPFPLGGAQHRWLRPSAVGGLLRFSAWTGLAGNQRDACLRTVAVHPWLCKCGAPDRSGRARCGLLWPRAQQQEQCLAGAIRTAPSSTTAPCGSNSSVCSPQSRGPLIKS